MPQEHSGNWGTCEHPRNTPETGGHMNIPENDRQHLVKHINIPGTQKHLRTTLHYIAAVPQHLGNETTLQDNHRPWNPWKNFTEGGGTQHPGVTSHPLPHPGFLLQPGHHDHCGGSLLPHHPPEVAHGLGQRALSGDVGILLAVAVDVVGVDVITPRNTYRQTAGHSRAFTREPRASPLSLRARRARERAAPCSPSMEVSRTREWS